MIAVDTAFLVGLIESWSVVTCCETVSMILLSRLLSRRVSDNFLAWMYSVAIESVTTNLMISPFDQTPRYLGKVVMALFSRAEKKDFEGFMLGRVAF